MSHTADVLYLSQLAVQILIYIVSIRLQGSYLCLTDEVRQHLASTAAVVIEEDNNLGRLVHQAPDISLLVFVHYLDAAPCLVTVHDGILLQGNLL